MNIIDQSVLIVDDKLENTILLKGVLENEGFSNVHTLNDSRKFHNELEEKKADVILLDVNMPYVSGVEILEDWNKFEENIKIPIIVITAQTDQDLKLKCLELGAMDFVTKPFDIQEVLHRVKNNLVTWTLQKQIKNQNEILEQKVKIRTKELQESHQDIIYRLSRMSEYRDNDTGKHVARVGRYSHLLALGIGLDQETANRIMLAAPMHDVGKVGVPDNILLNPGKLSTEEFDLMKTHTTIGAQILSNAPTELITTAHNIALNHHEKWNGSGYPNGLSGNEITLEGRIVAIADVFDALTSKRPYKEAWPVEDAVDYIREEAGEHFDPELVEVFMKNLPDFIESMDYYKNA